MAHFPRTFEVPIIRRRRTLGRHAHPYDKACESAFHKPEHVARHRDDETLEVAS